MKRKIFTLVMCTFLGAALVNAQAPTGVIKTTAVAPEIDGVIDAAWDVAPPINLDKPFTGETPTLGETGETYFQIMFDDAGIYVLVNVNDDEWYPFYEASSGSEWQYDKIEVYFDVNEVLKDGVGGGGGNGHYQLAPAPVLENIGGIATTDATGWVSAYNVTDDKAYVFEMFVPWDKLKNADGEAISSDMTMIGFDIAIADNDVATSKRHRAVWANDGSVDSKDSYANMDNCGTMSFEGGAEIILVESVAIAAPGGATVIASEGGSLQFTSTVLPATATNSEVKWVSVNKTGLAYISQTGALLAVKNGTVGVMAKAVDASGKMSDTIWIEIKNQAYSINDLSLLKEGTFPFDGKLGGAWSASGLVAEAYDGVLSLTPTTVDPANQWKAGVNQQKFMIYNDTTYQLRFTAWSDTTRVVGLDFEDNGDHGYNRYGDSPDADAVGGKSEWQVELTLEPVDYLRTVTFKRLDETSTIQFNIFMAVNANTVYFQNVSLVSLGQLNEVTPPATSIVLKAFAYGTETLATSFATGGQYQVSATIEPANAGYPMWSIVKGTGDATIDAEGKLIPVSAGTVTVVGKDPVDPTVKGEMVIDIAVGVKEDLANQFNIYPNPVTNELNVEMTSVNSKVVIFNSLGSKIHEVMVNGLTTTIDVSNMARGVYYIQVNDSAAQKFVK